MSTTANGITFPRGFKASGLACGIKKQNRPDLALVYSEVPATAAAVFTTNQVQAAPVIISREHIKSGSAQAILLNSGNANACTGVKGLADAKTTAGAVANLLNCRPEAVLLASTGVIGVPLPLPLILNSLSSLTAKLSTSGGAEAAQAIMTTDTFAKEAAVTVELGGREVRIGGMAKGSGMIQPQMATMLGVITTDAPLGPEVLNNILRRIVNQTFNRITVDGDTSTNDTVFLLANGCAGGEEITGGAELEKFSAALHDVAMRLAHMIVQDGEGATKFLTIQVTGARTEAEAETAARAVANSNLVKTAFFGEDANWGRVLAAVGYSGIDFAPEQTEILLADLPVFAGTGLPFCEQTAKSLLQQKEITVKINLHQGEAEATIWTCDLSDDYVKINGSYRT
ncbi:MAG: bifunctional glutamate N-acetyltransferase/amino-acid acetyltransferase ArgJ [Firmicutes bacterium]|nr:bifunctional glutamate N-acetyltransferase/amino-acid acetyltransferase ArgJ [Bacillota bacterium]